MTESDNKPSTSEDAPAVQEEASGSSKKTGDQEALVVPTEVEAEVKAAPEPAAAVPPPVTPPTPPIKPASVEPEARSVASAPPPKAKRSWLGAISLLLVLVVIGGLGAGAWWAYPQWQARTDELTDIQAQLDRERLAVADLEQRLIAAEDGSAQVASTINAAQSEQNEQLRAMTERLNAHNQRLLSLSNTSREDWQLAEAHYLLRLASQRLLVDRSATSALGLMESTDAILRELNMPDLFPVRQALAQDLGAVRLAAEVDREGVFLRLQGLIDNIDRLPMFEPPSLPALTQEEATVITAEPENWGERILGWLKGAGSAIGKRLDRYFAVRDHDALDPPMLPPSASEYLRQNVRFNMEQAQVALLREQQTIYRASLEQTRDLVDRYFADSPGAGALNEELLRLADIDIQTQLPSISGSLSQLQAYIERLHKLAPRDSQESGS